jgi:hypothetical protein
VVLFLRESSDRGVSISGATQGSTWFSPSYPTSKKPQVENRHLFTLYNTRYKYGINSFSDLRIILANAR